LIEFDYLDNHQARLGTKGELLMNRDLTKYLNQLRRAKIVCERCITANGGRSYLLVDASTNKTNLANRKVNILSIKKNDHLFLIRYFY
jgi:hypothetical protein